MSRVLLLRYDEREFNRVPDSVRRSQTVDTLAKFDAHQEGLRAETVAIRVRADGSGWDVTVLGVPDGGPFDHSEMD